MKPRIRIKQTDSCWIMLNPDRAFGFEVIHINDVRRAATVYDLIDNGRARWRRIGGALAQKADAHWLGLVRFA